MLQMLSDVQAEIDSDASDGAELAKIISQPISSQSCTDGKSEDYASLYQEAQSLGQKFFLENVRKLTNVSEFVQRCPVSNIIELPNDDAYSITHLWDFSAHMITVPVLPAVIPLHIATE